MTTERLQAQVEAAELEDRHIIKAEALQGDMLKLTFTGGHVVVISLYQEYDQGLRVMGWIV